MLVLNGIDNVPSAARGAAMAIGNFDGVHRGHQALLAGARKSAVAIQGPSGAILFEPHPREFSSLTSRTSALRRSRASCGS